MPSSADRLSHQAWRIMKYRTLLSLVYLLVAGVGLFGCNESAPTAEGKPSDVSIPDDGKKDTLVLRKGVTLAGKLDYFTSNNFANLQKVLDSGAGVIGVNLPWYAATQPCADCPAERPDNPRDWNDSTYAASKAVQDLDRISSYVDQNGEGAILMVIAYGTPGWAACPRDDKYDTRFYPPQNAADFGDFMYAMSERYNGSHVSDSGREIGAVRDWVIYNEVNAPDWWHNTACNSNQRGPVTYYGDVLNEAYSAVHHLPASSEVRVLAGGFTSYHRADYEGRAGLRISPSHQEWKRQTEVLQGGGQNHAWISPLDFVEEMKRLDLQFDAVALHPYSPRIYGDPLAQPPEGGVSLGNLSVLLTRLQDLWPNEKGKWHLALTEYHLQSHYGDQSLGWDHTPEIPCPNYFCKSTSEEHLNSYLQAAYSPRGADRPYVDYLIWTMWRDVAPYTGGIVRGDGSDKTEGIPSGSVRETYTNIE